MNALTRKQREIATRHELFLDIARSVLADEGCHVLSMDRIAELAEYSKGTVYQHFTCKEEILIQLCNTSMTQLLTLFRRAAEFEGNHRERLMAIFFAHSLWARLDPKSVDMLQHLGTDGVKEKVTNMSAQRHDELEKEIFVTVSGIVQSAIEDGDLPPNDALNPVEIVYGLWALNYGGQLLQSYNIPLDALGVRNPTAALTQITIATLNGLQWQPLHQPDSCTELFARFRAELFTKELEKIDAFIQ